MQMINSFCFAVNGIIQFFKNDANGRVQLLAATFVVPLGLALHLHISEWIAIMGCIAIVLSFEMMNTAIETICDLVQPGFHPMIKKIKDVAAGAVLLVSVMSALVGTLIFLPKLITLVC